MKPSHNYLLKLVGIVAAVCLLTGPVMTFVAYPTQQHREAGHAVEQAAYDVFTDGKDFTAVYESEQYKQYSESAEYNYSSNALLVGSVLSGLALITLPGWVYFRLRRTRAAKNAIGATFTVVAIPYILINLIGGYVFTKLLLNIPGLGAASEALAVTVSIAVTLVIFIVVLMLWQSFYEKRHNFVVE